jgi:hypothetical protein
MAIGSLTTTINESRESEQRFHKDEWKYCESEWKLLAFALVKRLE